MQCFLYQQGNHGGILIKTIISFCCTELQTVSQLSKTSFLIWDLMRFFLFIDSTLEDFELGIAACPHKIPGYNLSRTMTFQSDKYKQQALNALCFADYLYSWECVCSSVSRWMRLWAYSCLCIISVCVHMCMHISIAISSIIKTYEILHCNESFLLVLHK